MKKLFILIALILNIGCLKAVRSSFDSPKGMGALGFFGELISQATTPTTPTTPTYTIGGTITGFTSGTLILQLNTDADTSIAANTKYTFSTKLATGTAYTITIKTNPTGSFCLITNATGTVSSADISNVNITCAVATVTALYPTNGANWNDYIKRDFANDVFSQTDNPDCSTTPPTTGGYSTCVHAGAIRKFDLPSRSSCTNLTGSDSAGALNWICRTNTTTGGISFYSTGLKKGKGLSDLIDWTANGWKLLTFTVMDGTTMLLQTEPSKTWWGNGFASTFNSTTFVAGQINLFTSAYTGSITPGVSKAILLFKSAASSSIITINTTACDATNGSGVNVTNRNFTWIEGKINLGNSTANQYGIYLNGTKFTVLKNVGVQNAGSSCGGTPPNYGIFLSSSTNNLLEGVSIANTVYTGTGGCVGTGINLTSSSYNSLIDVVSANNTTKGIEFYSPSTNNIILGAVTMNNGGAGFSIQGTSTEKSPDNILNNVLSINNNSDGVNFNTIGMPPGDNSIFTNLATINNGGNGVSSSNISGVIFQNTALLSNDTNGMLLVLVSSPVYIKGVFKVFGNTSSACSINDGSSVGGISNTGTSCNIIAPSDSITPMTTGSISRTSTFFGSNGTTTDLTNLIFNTSSSFNYASITDWLNFSNRYRGIGNSAATAFPDTSNRGRCSSGACYLWDFSLKSNDSVLLNANMTSGCPTENSAFKHTWSQTGVNGQSICTTNYPGSTWNSSFGLCYISLLRNSVELIGDGVGNDNGLCEANEDCLVTPNIGAYQGHGNIVSASTVGSKCVDIPSLGIKLYQYEFNGY
jgi:hypothetical protein